MCVWGWGHPGTWRAHGQVVSRGPQCAVPQGPAPPTQGPSQWRETEHGEVLGEGYYGRVGRMKGRGLQTWKWHYIILAHCSKKNSIIWSHPTTKVWYIFGLCPVPCRNLPKPLELTGLRVIEVSFVMLMNDLENTWGWELIASGNNLLVTGLELSVPSLTSKEERGAKYGVQPAMANDLTSHSYVMKTQQRPKELRALPPSRGAGRVVGPECMELLIPDPILALCMSFIKLFLSYVLL